MTGTSARPMLVSTVVPVYMVLLLLAGNAYSADKEKVPPVAGAALAPLTIVPKVPEFRSPLESFKSYSEVEPVPWKEANDRVGEIGGWRVYAREAFEPEEPVEKGGSAGERR